MGNQVSHRSQVTLQVFYKGTGVVLKNGELNIREPRLSMQQEWVVPEQRHLLVESLHMEANPDFTQQLTSRPSQAQPGTELSKALRRKEMV